MITTLYLARARARARARVDGRSPAPPEQGGGAPPLPVYAKFWKPGRAAACCLRFSANALLVLENVQTSFEKNHEFSVLRRKKSPQKFLKKKIF